MRQAKHRRALIANRVDRIVVVVRHEMPPDMELCERPNLPLDE
jgi:hypothetical protein